MRKIKIMFVCTGNTCRSPLAQAILEDKLDKLNIKDIEVDSAGINCAEGMDVSPNSQQVLKEMNIDFSHKSKAINMDDIADNDYIVCMTQSHKKALSLAVPEEKLFTMDEVAGSGDIIDPYGQSIEIYRKTAEQINDAVDKILIQLTQNLK